MKTKVLVCSCNGTIDLAAARLAAGLPASVEVLPAARELCRRDVPRFVEALGGTDDVVVACTQEAALFNELADAKQVVAPLRFVNVRELAGWVSSGPTPVRRLRPSLRSPRPAASNPFPPSSTGRGVVCSSSARGAMRSNGPAGSRRT